MSTCPNAPNVRYRDGASRHLYGVSARALELDHEAHMAERHGMIPQATRLRRAAEKARDEARLAYVRLLAPRWTP